MLVQMATREMSPKPFIPKALGMELMMRPPADRPTKNMKHVRYKPQLVELFMPVMPRPNIS